MKIEIDITDQMPEIVEFIRDQTEIDLDHEQVADIFSKESRLVTDIAEWGWYDTEVRGRIIGVITHRFLGRGWPTYGEKMNIRQFINDLKKAAEGHGYKTLDASGDEEGEAEDGQPTASFGAVSTVPFMLSGGSSSASERWAFTTGGDDVALRTKVYAAVNGSLARSALATMFPDGSAQAEINRRIKERQEADLHYFDVRDAVIEDIANEVRSLCEKLSMADENLGQPRAPFIALLTLRDGTERLLFGGHTPSNEA
ncbi:hypothetical protein OIU34_18530 [Pararhizobium sp. BT-229]|uniref:hypothetical protein n=1 Tax=Pararhizobium sp. BT-229 TaxID=2986923 RepID=UPI0021F6EFD3|nr:hypothetical protein [Pararhizobium sp. BT-229]MCV9963876.1 hypothetical protein [Pararhizobium sp. BT-229]